MEIKNVNFSQIVIVFNRPLIYITAIYYGYHSLTLIDLLFNKFCFTLKEYNIKVIADYVKLIN